MSKRVLLFTLCFSSKLFAFTLVWSDEFNLNGPPDTKNWTKEIGGAGWGNNELQYYTNRDENSYVQDGNLIITAKKENFLNRKYTSARLISRYKQQFMYGRMEARIKLPHGRGLWPAFWMLPTHGIHGNGGWPNTGEIDIMEYVGFDPNWIHGTLHNRAYGILKKGLGYTSKYYVENVEDDFHVYAIEWSATKMDFFIDDQKYFTAVNDGQGWKTWPFDTEFFFILNVAVGGDWGGQQGVDNSVFPQQMLVDYVRVYQ